MRPTVIMKSAMTIDGQLAAVDGTSQWITGPEAVEDAHRCRASVDAVMVGAGTLLADDPQLNVRLDGYDGPQPVPVVVAGRRALPTDARLFDRDPIVLSPTDLDLAAKVLTTPDASGTRVDLREGLARLAGLGIDRILVEGGAGLLAALWRDHLIDGGILYYGAKLAGGIGIPLFQSTWSTLDDAQAIVIESARLVGADLRVEFQLA